MRPSSGVIGYTTAAKWCFGVSVVEGTAWVAVVWKRVEYLSSQVLYLYIQGCPAEIQTGTRWNLSAAARTVPRMRPVVTVLRSGGAKVRENVFCVHCLNSLSQRTLEYRPPPPRSVVK
jgi:hypothetical protein